MFVEMHLLQNFAPNNLNRDDTGAPKDCTFGGVRRARISSQCQKHAIRRQFEKTLFKGPQLATRTKRIVERIAQELTEKGNDPEASKRVVTALLAGANLTVEEDKTQYLLYLGADEIARWTALCEKHWNVLDRIAAAIEVVEEVATDEEKRAAKSARKKDAGAEKAKQAPALPDEVQKAIVDALGSSKAIDLGLFGRMLADCSEKNIDAACQVAHAVSVNEVSMEIDYFTAIDDLKPDDVPGAEMLGNVDFNSSCFYRYAKIDLELLTSNLVDDEKLAREATAAFLRAMITAIPTGKQNSMAAHNPPAYVRVLVRESGEPWNLLNAFVRPIRVRRGGEEDLVGLAITALGQHYEQLMRMYSGTDAAPKAPMKDLVANMYDDKSLSLSALLAELMQAIKVEG